MEHLPGGLRGAGLRPLTLLLAVATVLLVPLGPLALPFLLPPLPLLVSLPFPLPLPLPPLPFPLALPLALSVLPLSVSLPFLVKKPNTYSL